jgi:hypothetical protein
MSCSIGVKLSCGLVLTGCWVHPNCNLVLNCAGSSRRLLREKLQDGNTFPSQNMRKGPGATFSGTDGVLLTVRNRKEGCCPWSLVATTCHIQALKLTASLRLMIKSLFLVLNTRLTSACISFPPNQVCSLVHVYHWAIPWWFCNLLPFYSIGARVSLISREYSTWHRSTLKPCGHDLNHALVYPSCPNVLEKITFERANVWFSMEVLAPWRMSTLTLGYEKVCFLFQLSLELLNQEDQMMKCNTSRVARHHLMRQGALSSTHRRKSYIGNHEDPLLDYSDILWSLWPMHPSSFSCAPLLS